MSTSASMTLTKSNTQRKDSFNARIGLWSHDFPVITVYHPLFNKLDNTFANVAWAGKSNLSFDQRIDWHVCRTLGCHSVRSHSSWQDLRWQEFWWFTFRLCSTLNLTIHPQLSCEDWRFATDFLSSHFNSMWPMHEVPTNKDRSKLTKDNSWE